MKKYNDDISRASFQMEGVFALFRHVQMAGTNEYLREDFKGNIIASVVEPDIAFHSFVEEQVKIIIDGVDA